jgi:hypothetical protein
MKTYQAKLTKGILVFKSRLKTTSLKEALRQFRKIFLGYAVTIKV